MAGPSSLDQAAKKMGFNDYAHYQAWQAHQEIMRQGPARVGVGTVGAAPAPTPAQPAQPATPPQNWLQRLMWGLNGGK